MATVNMPEKKPSTLQTLLPTAGTVAGSIIGGPVGGAIGGMAGGMLAGKGAKGSSVQPFDGRSKVEAPAPTTEAGENPAETMPMNQNPAMQRMLQKQQRQRIDELNAYNPTAAGL